MKDYLDILTENAYADENATQAARRIVFERRVLAVALLLAVFGCALLAGVLWYKTLISTFAG